MSPDHTSRNSAPGLLAQAADVSSNALRSGALLSMRSSCETVEEGGIRYALRLLESLRRKDAARPRGTGNPFLPYEEALFVRRLPPQHVVLLNKFNVVPDHLLLVTAVFESQEAPLSPEDIEAACVILNDIDGLVFFNGGVTAGSSQAHKHLQVVPRAAVGCDGQLPVDDAVMRAITGADAQALPFAHACSAVSPANAQAAHATYESLLREVGIDPRPAAGACAPYNWLMTRRWMMLVPRTAPSWNGIEVNALGFAGALLTRDAEAAERVKAAGPSRVLAAVTGAA